ncbi:hypothetical protein M103_4939 [Bacteroides fragilis str. 1007-1-F |nr:hypothetical protein M103_4939 [Bacteroides fragilis str. 1007-1-F \
MFILSFKLLITISYVCVFAHRNSGDFAHTFHGWLIYDFGLMLFCTVIEGSIIN